MTDDIRLPPHAREAERSLLGSLMRDNLIIPEIIGKLREEDFYVFGHRQIFKGIVAIGTGVDYLTLTEWLRSAKQLDEAGGVGYLVDLWDAAPGGSGNAAFYADIIREKAEVRELIHTCNEIAAGAFDVTASAGELLESASKRLFEIAMRGAISRTETFDEVGRRFFEEMDRRMGTENGEVLSPSLSSGWHDLDNLISGFFKGELTVLAARPSQGKTLVAGCIAASIAERGFPVFFSCMEQRSVEIFSRCVSAKGQVPSNLIRSGHLDAMYRDRMLRAGGELRDLPIFMDDAPAQSTVRIGATARRHIQKDNLQLVVVDYLQLVDPESRREPRHEQVGGIARRLKLLARELDVPIIALAQVGRSAENRADRRPTLADLKESGGIEEHADCVMFLHKSEPFDQHRAVDQIEVIVAKCRNGPTGSIWLAHDKRHFAVTQAAIPGQEAPQ